MITNVVELTIQNEKSRTVVTRVCDVGASRFG